MQIDKESLVNVVEIMWSSLPYNPYSVSQLLVMINALWQSFKEIKANYHFHYSTHNNRVITALCKLKI